MYGRNLGGWLRGIQPGPDRLYCFTILQWTHLSCVWSLEDVKQLDWPSLSALLRRNIVSNTKSSMYKHNFFNKLCKYLNTGRIYHSNKERLSWLVAYIGFLIPTIVRMPTNIYGNYTLCESFFKDHFCPQIDV